MKSREELVRRALDELGVVGAGQTASAEDSAVIDEAIEPVMSDLATRNVYAWGDPDEYDEDAFEHLAVILANAKSRLYGIPPSEETRLMAERRLRQLNPYVLSGQPQDVEFY